jgi:hypothetical protein
MIDSDLELYDAAVNTAPNTDVAGSWVNLGRGGLPSGAQFIVGIDNPGGVSGDNPVVKCQLQLTLDNNTSRKLVTEFEIDPSAGFEGQLVREIGQDFNVQKYAGANVDVRFILNPVSDNTSNNVTADRVFAFIGYGEKQVFGRKGTADTLYT